jgi:dTDP-4-dehydrorhamnose 3,5-epimerase
MKIVETSIAGVLVLQSDPKLDERGSFVRTWDRSALSAHGAQWDIAQIGVAENMEQGTLRGLHLQAPPYAEAKTIRCIRGRMFDVAVDVRPDSSTFLGWLGHELSGDATLSLHVPAGCAHGYLTLEPDTAVEYIMSTPYHPPAAIGYRFDDAAFRIQWPAPVRRISARDESWPSFSFER